MQRNIALVQQQRPRELETQDEACRNTDMGWEDVGHRDLLGYKQVNGKLKKRRLRDGQN